MFLDSCFPYPSICLASRGQDLLLRNPAGESAGRATETAAAATRRRREAEGRTAEGAAVPVQRSQHFLMLGSVRHAADLGCGHDQVLGHFRPLEFPVELGQVLAFL